MDVRIGMEVDGGGWIGRRKEKGGREGGREGERWDWSHVYMYICIYSYLLLVRV